MHALIVEDSREDALNLRLLLDSMPLVESVAQAGSLEEARGALDEIRPDVVFLDVELGLQNGLDLLPSLPPSCRVILTTVHTGYGPQAFEANATDYMVKPVTEVRLLRAMAKMDPSVDPSDTVVQVYRGGSQRFSIPLAAVAAVVADRDHTLLYCGRRSYPDHRRFSEWVRLTHEQSFTQLDRSTLVRRDLVHSWQPYGAGLKLKFHHSPMELELGRAAAKRFLGHHA